MADFIYNSEAKRILEGSRDLLNDTIKVGLSNSNHTPNRDHDFADNGGGSDFVDGELSGAGYSRKELTSKSIVVDKANNRAEFDAADVTWTGIDAGTAAQATLLFEGGANDTATELIANIDSGGFPKTTNGGDLTIQWNAEGIIHLTT